MNRKKETGHKVEYKSDKGNQVEEVLIWHNTECLFHLKRMAGGFVWFSTYVNGQSKHVEIKIDGEQITMKDSDVIDSGKSIRRKPDRIKDVKTPAETETQAPSETPEQVPE
jgi:hypothetical protein